jgi:hypothetical protein
MAAQFVAYNCAIDSTTGVMAGTSYTTGAKCGIQLVPASGSAILVVEIGISFSGTTAGTPSIVTLADAGAAATGLVAHSTSTIMATGSTSKTSTLQMGTALSGYGAVAIVTNTTARQYWGAQVGTTTQYEKQYPLGREPFLPSGGFLQMRINTAATLTAIGYIVLEEV